MSKRRDAKKPRQYVKYPCDWCGKLISNNGAASSAHAKMHEREHAELATAIARRFAQGR